MTEGPSSTFMYDHCDVPEGESLSDWRTRRARPQQRRAQVTGGFIAALATFAPIVFSVRGSRNK